MKNREKFKDEIINIVCNGGNLAVDKEKYTPIPCIKIECNRCLFYDDGCRIGKLKEWAEKEYKDTTVISRSDIIFLTYIKDEFKYMARHENGNLYAYEVNPKKYKQYGFWVGGVAASIFKFDVDFPMVKYTDEQAWKISDLKKLKVVENY
jgi:hypothetical protein